MTNNQQNDYHCTDCLSIFRSNKCLLHHQKIAKYCHKYKNTVFTCTKCLYSTKGIKNIDLHNENCKNTEQLKYSNKDNDEKELVAKLEKENLNYKAELEFLKEKLQSQEKLYTQIRLERFKNKIYSNLIEQNTSIRIGDVLTEEEDGIHIYNTQGGNITVFIHDYISDEDRFTIIHQNTDTSKENPKKIINNTKSQEQKSIDIEKHFDTISLTNKRFLQESDSQNSENEIQPVKKKETIINQKHLTDNKQKLFPLLSDRSIKSREKSYHKINECKTEPSKKERMAHIVSIDNTIQSQMNKFFDLDNMRVEFENSFNALKNTRVYTKILKELMKHRISVFGRMSLAEYQELVSEHIRIIEEIFRKKNYTEKKSKDIILKGLSPLESRLVAYNKYETSYIEPDDLMLFAEVLELNIRPPKEYVSFSMIKVYNLLCNYSVALFPIKRNLERCLFNRYGFHNIIYLPLQGNNNDPYSFYVLEDVNEDRRYWKMDCRLEDIGEELSNYVTPYMIRVFRKIYQDVFKDNEYRVDFKDRYQLTECDCEQLLQNIFLLGQPKKFCTMIRNLVKQKATHSPTENDKFNVLSDDTMQRIQFHKEKDNIEDLIDITKQIFDGISSEDAFEFCRNRI